MAGFASALRCQEEKSSQRKWPGQKLQSVKNYHKDEETITILCQCESAKKFEFPWGERLWKSLWRMWKTLSYQQVFLCLGGAAAGIGKIGLCPRFFDWGHYRRLLGIPPNRCVFAEKVAFGGRTAAKQPGGAKSVGKNL